MTTNIELKNVSASYDYFNLSNINFTIKKGEIVGLSVKMVQEKRLLLKLFSI